jgi:hypothetical protein
MKTLFACLLGILLLTACNHPRLELGGAYHPAATNSTGQLVATAAPDFTLLSIDSTYDLAYQSALAACRFEKANRAALQKIFPDIKRDMDAVRETIWQIDGRWAQARLTYLQNPVPANLDALRRALAEMNRWNQTALSLLPKETP